MSPPAAIEPPAARRFTRPWAASSSRHADEAAAHRRQGHQLRAAWCPSAELVDAQPAEQLPDAVLPWANRLQADATHLPRAGGSLVQLHHHRPPWAGEARPAATELRHRADGSQVEEHSIRRRSCGSPVKAACQAKIPAKPEKNRHFLRRGRPDPRAQLPAHDVDCD
jgi:hypothetical protein